MNKGKYTLWQCETDINALKNEWVARWIPVTERLPENGNRVLVCFINGHIDIIEFSEVGEKRHILAWMPLPDPYEEER